MPVFAGICALLTFICLGLFKNRKIAPFVTTFASLFAGLLLVFNLVNSVTIYARQSNVGDSQIKQSYSIEARDAADMPNVYWLHFDGMLGFSSMEKYFGNAQTEFEQALGERGVIVNRDAAFAAGHHTSSCVPALLCPDFYDYQYSLWQASASKGAGDTFEAFYNRNNDSVMHLQQINAELFAAFKRADYRLINLVDFDLNQHITLTGDVQYHSSDNQLIQVSLEESSQALRFVSEMTTLYQNKNFCSMFLQPVSLLIDVDGAAEESYLQKNVMTLTDDLINTPTIQTLAYAINEETEPFICFVPFLQAHDPFNHDENGYRIATNDIMNYPAQHKYTTKVMLQAIDTIILNDPDAVIVVQADHGIHVTPDEALYAAFGEQTVIDEFRNSTMSGIRVPEKYQNGEEAYALQNPLNMSRYLVNNFVGHNYTYLAEQ